MNIPMFAVVINAAVWVAQWKYLGNKMAAIESKHDRMLDELDGLRVYLYEIDPQFDDERAVRAKIAEGVPLHVIHRELQSLDERRGQGARTLSSPFCGRSLAEPT